MRPIHSYGFSLFFEGCKGKLKPLAIVHGVDRSQKPLQNEYYHVDYQLYTTLIQKDFKACLHIRFFFLSC
jgi:hypothetical protein